MLTISEWKTDAGSKVTPVKWQEETSDSSKLWTLVSQPHMISRPCLHLNVTPAPGVAKMGILMVQMEADICVTQYPGKPFST